MFKRKNKLPVRNAVRDLQRLVTARQDRIPIEAVHELRLALGRARRVAEQHNL